jgi:polyisoprenoid-binding protein YceI
MITNVTGTLKNIDASIESVNADFSSVKVSFKADLSGIDTGNAQRDGHLKSPDFFDVAQFPDATFESSDYNPKEDKIKGILTIKGISKPVSLDVEFGGTNKDPYGNEKVGFSITGKINRTDWGLSWNAALETGGVMVSEEVKIAAEVQFIKQA